MILHGKRFTFKFLIVVFITWTLIFSPRIIPAEGPLRVVQVFDGDTFRISDGRTVRLLGIDTPERGEPGAEVARQWLAVHSLGRDVNLVECNEKDKYGRTLALVEISGRKLNFMLAGEGLAEPMLIPPCANAAAETILEASASALGRRAGVYRSPLYDPVSHLRASERLGKRSVVFGKVLNIHKGKKAVHLNFGSDWKTDFTAVLFHRGLFRFKALGLDPEDLVGRDVFVLGKIESYYGPQIVVNIPEQILPLPEEDQ